MSAVFGAASAFVALGAVGIASVLLLMLNPRSREVRWYVLFQLGLVLWLLGQGLWLSSGPTPAYPLVIAAAVHMLPVLFLASALVDVRGISNVQAWLVVAIGALFLPVALPAWEGVWGGAAGTAFAIAWHLAGWGGGSWLYAHAQRGRTNVFRAAAEPRFGRVLIAALLLVAPISIVIGFLIEGGRFFFYVMPWITVGIQLLVFAGVIHLRFYDIEVRAARSGELAATGAEQERLAVLGEIAASVAHEVRNPLTGVRSLAQRLAEEEIDAPTRLRYASVILDELGRVERIVANLLGFARRAVVRIDADASTELAPLLDDLLLLVDGRAREAGVRLQVRANGIVVRAPREPLAQALLNLILNALAHTPPAGVVRLDAAGDGDTVRITVSDTGTGVAPEDRERIFEPFHTASGGTGLGLAVVRRIARELGGTIEVTDAAGGGAQFVLRLPAAPGSAAAGVA